MTFDNANRKSIREAEKSARLAEANRIAYTRTIMSTAFGRAWLHDLLLRCNVFHTPFVANSPDITAFNCGGQNIGLRLFGDVAANCPHEYSLMMTEASTKEAANERRFDDHDTGRDTSAASLGRYPTQPADTAFGVDASGFVHDASSDSADESERTSEDA